MKTVKARLYWLSPEEGGKKQIPSGPVYTPVSRFEDTKLMYPDIAWSVVVTFITSVDNNNCNIVEIKFLVEDAPHELLYTGSKFELHEINIVAKGVIIE